MARASNSRSDRLAIVRIAPPRIGFRIILNNFCRSASVKRRKALPLRPAGQGALRVVHRGVQAWPAPPAPPMSRMLAGLADAPLSYAPRVASAVASNLRCGLAGGGSKGHGRQLRLANGLTLSLRARADRAR